MIKSTFVLFFVLLLAGCPRGVHRALADYTGDVDEIWIVQGNANKRLQDYHRFEDTYQQIKSKKASLVMRINNGETFSELTPEIMIINQWIGEYNGRSKQYDRAMWKSPDLPYQLNLISSVDDLKK